MVSSRRRIELKDKTGQTQQYTNGRVPSDVERKKNENLAFEGREEEGLKFRSIYGGSSRAMEIFTAGGDTLVAGAHLRNIEFPNAGESPLPQQNRPV